MKKSLIIGAVMAAQSILSAGVASWYGKECEGNYTANGELFDSTKMTCASWHYPFGTILLVENINNGKKVIVRVNDRGPAKRLNREIDLARSAFEKIADPDLGLVNVTVTKIK